MRCVAAFPHCEKNVADITERVLKRTARVIWHASLVSCGVVLTSQVSVDTFLGSPAPG